jgi:formylglycine-generating enzyme required for sulfatase activity
VKSERTPGDRLERAIELLMGGPPSTRAEVDALLAAHPDLRELLEPMLEGSGAAPAADDAVLGDFRLVRELGRGGMGIVHEAWQRSLDRKVAVKVLAPALVARPAAVARFRREAAAAARLRHPHIVEVYGFGSEAGQHFFAMQFVDGMPLSNCMDRFRAPAAALALVAQVVEALEHAHARGLVHRDVKPDNVLVRADGAALLTDFGIARDEELPSVTQAGAFLGTLAYAAPEQIRGEAVDARVDVWSVGVLLHELLAGVHPFAAATQQALQHAILTVEPADLRGVDGVSDDLAAIVAQAMAKDRQRRYASATALLADLRALREGRHVSARLPTTGERLLRWARREPWRATALAVLLAGLAASALGFALAAHRAGQNGLLAAAETTAKHALADKVRDFDLLAGVVHWRRAREREARLFPAWPRHADAMRAWLQDDCGRLERLRPELARALQTLQPTTAAGGDDSARFLHDTLAALARDLDTELPPLRAAMTRRLAWATQIAAATAAHPHAGASWADARRALAAAPAYAAAPPALADDDVLGLVPIGANPATGLWEFADLASAWDGETDPRTLPIPRHDAHGNVPVTDASGIVFVLLPGGRCLIGSQAGDPDGGNHDPEAPGFVGPVHEVDLAPFLIARHELTRAQWARLCRGDDDARFPSGYPTGADNYRGGKITGTHPVERVEWTSASRVLGEHGMTMPTEAQWEYACRAGTETPYWTGADSSSLAGAANVYDVAATRNALKKEVHEAFDDGWQAHAPVGSFRANPFGLFDVHGNVGEWCLDAPAANRVGFRAGDGMKQSSERPNDRVQRGGSFQQQGRTGRASLWVFGPKETRAIDLGLRAVRRLAEK